MGGRRGTMSHFVFLGVYVCHFWAILDTKMGPKSTQGRLWDPIVPPGGPLSAQGCHLVRFGAHVGISSGPHSVLRYQHDTIISVNKTMLCGDGFCDIFLVVFGSRFEL